MNIILVIFLSLLIIQNNQAFKTSNQHVKSKKFKYFKDRVNTINADYKQGIWFRIGKRSKSPNKHAESLEYYKKYNKKHIWSRI
jgi:hypothetical protein